MSTIRCIVKPIGFAIWGFTTVVLRVTGHHLPVRNGGHVHASPVVETVVACIAGVVAVACTAFVIAAVRERL